jgi:nitrous oxide reductase accessory protein NosL
VRGARRVAPAGLAAVAVLLLAGCGHGEDAGQPAPASSSTTDLGHLQKLVDGADSAASKAESDMDRE